MKGNLLDKLFLEKAICEASGSNEMHTELWREILDPQVGTHIALYMKVGFYVEVGVRNQQQMVTQAKKVSSRTIVKAATKTCQKSNQAIIDKLLKSLELRSK